MSSQSQSAVTRLMTATCLFILTTTSILAQSPGSAGNEGRAARESTASQEIQWRLDGSTPWQSGNYVSVDCADCMAAAWSKWKGKPLTRDWNVAGIVGEWPKGREFDLEEGTPSGEIRWGTDIRPGDFVAVRYPGRRQYQHIGALYADANKNGKLDAEDLVIHAGPQALQISRLGAGNFDGRVSVIRATAR